MAPRTFWKGYLKLSLVTCPVAMTPATTDSAKVRFHTLNRATGNRVVSEYADAVSGKRVADDDLARGYPTAEDSHVVIEDEELEAVALENRRTLDIEMFVPADSIGWIFLDRPHFLTPDDKVGEEAYCVIRDAMAATGQVGISRLILHGREHAMMLAPREGGIVAWTLRYGDEVRDPREVFEAIGAKAPDAKAMKLMTALIAERTKDWSPDFVSDPVQAKLLDIIAGKKTKRPRKPSKAAPEPKETGGDNVVDIMEALRRSIAGDKTGKRKA